MSAAVAKPSAAKKTRGARKPSAAVSRAMNEMTDDLRKEVDHVRDQIEKLTEYDIEVRYDVGEKLNAIAGDKSGKYGTNPKQQMYAVMPLSRDAIRPMMELARTYSRDDVKKLRSYKNQQTGERLTWSHVVSLVRVKDKQKAFALADRAAAVGMSSRELNAEVIRAAGGPKSKGGRRAKKVASLAAAIDDIVTRSKSWQNVFDTVWSVDGGLSDLFAADSPSWPDRRPPQELCEAMVAAVGVIDMLGQKVRSLGVQLDALAIQARAARNARAVVT